MISYVLIGSAGIPQNKRLNDLLLKECTEMVSQYSNVS